jgi:hypothetical protein
MQIAMIDFGGAWGVGPVLRRGVSRALRRPNRPARGAPCSASPAGRQWW